MDLNSLTALVVAAQQGDNNANTQLQAVQQNDFNGYLLSLNTLLNSEATDPNLRAVVAIMLKNTVDSRDEKIRGMLAQRWMASTDSRELVKKTLVAKLSEPHDVIRGSIPIAISKFAAIEIPARTWPTLIDTLLHNVKDASTSTQTKQSSMDALGYVCEETSPEALVDRSSDILNAIASGVMSDQPTILLSAMSALANSIEFTSENWKYDNQRKMIMQLIFRGTDYDAAKLGNAAAGSLQPRIQEAAMRCLVQVALHYYEYLDPFMGEIFQRTTVAIEGNVERVSLQAIEFWSSVADVEAEILAEQQELAERERSAIPPAKCHDFIKKALPNLLPRLLKLLTLQKGDIDDDEWTVSGAAATCINLCATVVRDEIVHPVLQFVQANIQSADWHYKEAAIIAFGAILDGPDKKQLGDIVSEALNVILHSMNDPNPFVKDTASWTVGHICELHTSTIIKREGGLQEILGYLCNGLKDPYPRVAGHCAWAIHNIADSILQDQHAQQLSEALHPFFANVMEELFRCTARPDREKSNLMASTYEAISSLISAAPESVLSTVQQLVPALISQLQSTITAGSLSAEDRERINDVQGLLCGALQTAITRISANSAATFSAMVMETLLKLLESKNATVHQEALMAISAVVTRTERDFAQYIQPLLPYVLLGLQNANEAKVCSVTIGLVGDLTRALEEGFLPFADEVMKYLLQHLLDTNVDRSLKPPIISCIGDIALAIGQNVTRYLTYVLPVVVDASQFKFENTTDEDVDYMNELRESIAECYTGILQGLAASNPQHSLQIFNFPPFSEVVQKSGNPLAFLLDFLDITAKDPTTDMRTLKAVVGLVGDMGSTLGSNENVKRMIAANPSVRELIRLAKADLEDTELVETAQYAERIVAYGL